MGKENLSSTRGQDAFAMAETVRSMIRHENDLIHHRTQWLGMFQGFLFAALGYAWRIDSCAGVVLVWLFAAVACLSAISASQAFDDACKAIETLKRWWDGEKRKLAYQGLPYQGPDVIGFRRPRSWRDKLVIWYLMPRVLILIWILVALWRLLFYLLHLASPLKLLSAAISWPCL